MSDRRDFGQAQLRRVLDIMFPPSYIQLYHRPPHSVCSLLDLSSSYTYGDDDCNQRTLFEVSTEPSSRESVIAMRTRLDSSLKEHQAKPVGLCPIRRAIYDQCFDELIRQVTVGCVEQGLLLFRIRNELRMTLNSYKGIYESGVCFGINKSIGAQIELDRIRDQMQELEVDKNQSESRLDQERRAEQLEVQNRLESMDKLQAYYADETKRKDQVIEQQRSIIRALSQKLTSDMKSPI